MLGCGDERRAREESVVGGPLVDDTVPSERTDEWTRAVIPAGNSLIRRVLFRELGADRLGAGFHLFRVLDLRDLP